MKKWILIIVCFLIGIVVLLFYINREKMYDTHIDNQGTIEPNDIKEHYIDTLGMEYVDINDNYIISIKDETDLNNSFNAYIEILYYNSSPESYCLEQNMRIEYIQNAIDEIITYMNIQHEQEKLVIHINCKKWIQYPCYWHIVFLKLSEHEDNKTKKFDTVIIDVDKYESKAKILSYLNMFENYSINKIEFSNSKYNVLNDYIDLSSFDTSYYDILTKFNITFDDDVLFNEDMYKIITNNLVYTENDFCSVKFSLSNNTEWIFKKDILSTSSNDESKEDVIIK